MPTTPYNITISALYDTDGSTLMTGKIVTARNETTAETIQDTTDGSGSVILNIGNLTSGYTNGDVITIFSNDGDKTAYVQHTVDTSTGSYSTTLTYIDTSAADTTSLRYFTATEFREFFCLAAYNATTAPRGIKTIQIERIGEGIELEIDNILGQKFDDNDGSYYTATDEYHDALSNHHKDVFSEWAPIVSVTKFEVNQREEGDTASFTDLASSSDYDNDWNYESVTGRFHIEDSQWYAPRGTKQIRMTYTYGMSSVPKDIKRLAILMTGRSMGGAGLIANAISGTEMEGSGGSITILDSSYIQREIDKIISTRTRINVRNL